MLKISRFWSRKEKKIFGQTLQSTIQITKPEFSKFNLLIITQFYPPDYAATGQLIHDLVYFLSQKDIQVNVFTSQPGYAYKQKQAPVLETGYNIKVKRSRSTQLWSQRIRGKTLNGVIFTVRAILYLIKNAHQNNAVLLTTAPPFLSVIGYIVNFLFKTPYTCLIYDLYPDAAIELDVIKHDSLIAKIWHKLNLLIWQKSENIVVLSETMKQRVIAKHPTLASKISTIHNWADAEWIKPLPKQENWFACQHGLNQKFTVLYSGNLGRCHDLDTIIGAIKLLKQQPIQFVFIGAGAKHNLCRQTVTESNLTNCIFLPYQDRVHLPYSLTACDLALVSIAPGLEGVVAPSKVYGIMAGGKAIAAICEPNSYLRQLIMDAQCGESFNNNSCQELADFILTLAAHPEISEKMGKAGRLYMKQNFTPQIIAQKYYDILGIDPQLSEATITHEQQVQKANQDSWV